jgi:hypothetical protein
LAERGGTDVTQWKRNGVAIPGETGRSYKLRSADEGQRLKVTVTVTMAG